MSAIGTFCFCFLHCFIRVQSVHMSMKHFISYRKRRRSEPSDVSVPLSSLSPDDWEGLNVTVKSGRFVGTAATVQNVYLHNIAIRFSASITTLRIFAHYLCVFYTSVKVRPSG